MNYKLLSDESNEVYQTHRLVKKNGDILERTINGILDENCQLIFGQLITVCYKSNPSNYEGRSVIYKTIAQGTFQNTVLSNGMYTVIVDGQTKIYRGTFSWDAPYMFINGVRYKISSILPI
jgi:hypothetical protein